VLAERYASALYELAEPNGLDAVAADLRTLKGLIHDSVDLQRVLASPLIKRDVQGKAIAAVAQAAGISPLVLNVLGVMGRHRRLFALEAVADAFLALLAERRGETTAQVTAARPLSQAQIAAVTEAVRQAVSNKVSLDLKVDPRLLGGLVVKVGSRLFDSSLRTKLRRLETAMKGIG
jgi:F-type H+-transporting ATPase subunit delta